MSWEQLQSIVNRNAEELSRAVSEPPTDCYYDATPLDHNEAGVLHCKFCGRTFEAPYGVY